MAAAATTTVLTTADHVALARKRGGEDPNCAFLLAAVHTVQTQCAHLQRLLGQPVEQPTLAAAPRPGSEPMMALFDPAFPRERITEVVTRRHGYVFADLDWGQATDAFVMHWLDVWNLREREHLLAAMRHRIAMVNALDCEADGSLTHEVVDCIYFLTHWVLLRTEYGTRSHPFDEESKNEDLHEHFQDLFDALDTLRVPHHEAQAEVGLCYLLTAWIAHDQPPSMRAYLHRLLAMGAADTAAMTDEAAAHLHCLIALWNAVDDKHRLLHDWYALVPVHHPWPDRPSLTRDGFFVFDFDASLLPPPDAVRGTHGCLRLRRDGGALGIEGDLKVADRAPFLALRSSLVNTLFPGRAQAESDEIYLRRKAPTAHTGLHADYFHYRRESLLLDGIPDTEGDVCSTCNVDDGMELLLCERCGCGVHPLCVFPRVAAMPPGHWFCAACERQPFDYFTVWLPLHDLVEQQHSTLSVVPGSHLMRDWNNRLSEDTRCPGDLDPTRVCSGALRRGTAIVVNVKTVHGATRGREVRTSLDFRVRVTKQ